MASFRLRTVVVVHLCHLACSQSALRGTPSLDNNSNTTVTVSVDEQLLSAGTELGSESPDPSTIASHGESEVQVATTFNDTIATSSAEAASGVTTNFNDTLLTASMDNSLYVALHGGSCAAYGYADIMNAQECLAAATALQIGLKMGYHTVDSVTVSSPAGWSWIPKGCSTHKTDLRLWVNAQGTNNGLHLPLCRRVAPKVPMAACLLRPQNWERPYGNVALSEAGAEECKRNCWLGGYSYFGLECPMGSEVHCQCSNALGGQVVEQRFCEGQGMSTHNHCVGPYVQGRYRFGDAWVGSAYKTW